MVRRDTHRFINVDRSLWEHFSHANPTKMIFDQLRSIRSDDLTEAQSSLTFSHRMIIQKVQPGEFIRQYYTDLMPDIIDILEIIVKWLQVSVSEFNHKSLRLKI